LRTRSDFPQNRSIRSKYISLNLLSLGLNLRNTSSLVGESEGSSLSESLVSGSSGLLGVGEVLGSGGCRTTTEEESVTCAKSVDEMKGRTLSLVVVDSLHENSLVLEDVTLRLEVERVVPEKIERPSASQSQSSTRSSRKIVKV
jgi:hypothetical protein